MVLAYDGCMTVVLSGGRCYAAALGILSVRFNLFLRNIFERDKVERNVVKVDDISFKNKLKKLTKASKSVQNR